MTSSRANRQKRRRIPFVKRFSPLVILVAVLAVIAALRKTHNSAQQQAWKPVDPS